MECGNKYCNVTTNVVMECGKSQIPNVVMDVVNSQHFPAKCEKAYVWFLPENVYKNEYEN